MRHWIFLALLAVIPELSLSLPPGFPAQENQGQPQQNQKTKLSREEIRRQKALRVQMVNPYWEWLHDEVPYIITDQERAAFMSLRTDDAREQFIVDFWERRNPNPGSGENDYKVKYFQRFIYANETFGSSIPGWKTDRGRIYIMLGPPDSVIPFPSPIDTSTGKPSNPSERWLYKQLYGIGPDISMDFVGTNGDGECHLRNDPTTTASLWRLPGAGLTPDRNGAGIELDPYTKVISPPLEKLTDLKTVLASKLAASSMPFTLRPYFVRATDETTLTEIAIQFANRDIHFQNQGGILRDTLGIYGEIITLNGRTVGTFAKALELTVPEGDFDYFRDRETTYQTPLLLGPGRYKLALAAKDEGGGQMGAEDVGLTVPFFGGYKPSSSSLILTDQIMPLPLSMVENSPFVVGGMRVQPNLCSAFTRDQAMGIYMQVYNLARDDQTHKPSFDIRYSIEKDGERLLDQGEDKRNLAKASQQFTIVKVVSLKAFAPGTYTLQIDVTDKLNNQTISPTANFEVR